MRLVHLCQQFDVGRRIAANELVPAVASFLHYPCRLVARDESRHLRPAQSSHLQNVVPQNPLGRSLLAAVFVIYQRRRYPAMNLLPIARLKSEFLARRQERSNLFHAQPFSAFHADVQIPACGLRSPPGSLCVGNTCRLQAHPALYKTPLPSPLRK